MVHQPATPADTAGTLTTYAYNYYDLYIITDTSYTNKLNTAGALSPATGISKEVVGPVSRAADGSFGMAIYDASGNMVLMFVQGERHGSKAGCAP